MKVELEILTEYIDGEQLNTISVDCNEFKRIKPSSVYGNENKFLVNNAVIELDAGFSILNHKIVEE